MGRHVVVALRRKKKISGKRAIVQTTEQRVQRADEGYEESDPVESIKFFLHLMCAPP